MILFSISREFLQSQNSIAILASEKQEGYEYMPLYEYECKKCEKKFETLVSLKDLDDPAH